jgi:hypothetical protein
MSGIPLYPYRVTITFQPNTGRQPVTRVCANLPSAMGIFSDNIGRQNVHSVEIFLTIHKHTPTGME